MFARLLSDHAALKMIEERLPGHMKAEVRRLVLIAKGYIGRSVKAQDAVTKCSLESLIDAICTAAELGFALDGKFCYAVPYAGTLQCQISYLGMVAAAKRRGAVRDAWAEVVMPEDEFSISDQNGVRTYVFKRDITVSRDYDRCLGVHGVIVHAHGVTPEWMTKDEVDKRREMSKGKDRSDSPWRKWPEEMAKAKALRQAMKLHGDDPTIAAIIQSSDIGEDFEALLSRPVGSKRTAADVLADIDRQPPHQREESPHVEQERGQLFATGESAQEAGL